MENPLWMAIKKLTTAKRKRRPAHPKFIAMLELRVKEEARKVNEAMGGNAIAVMDKLAKQMSYPKVPKTKE